jgi:hypothetical protein
MTDFVFLLIYTTVLVAVSYAIGYFKARRIFMETLEYASDIEIVHKRLADAHMAAQAAKLDQELDNYNQASRKN